MEAEVFLLGHWKNYEELESSLSIEELLATVKAVYEKEDRHNRFQAMLNGIDIDDKSNTEDNDITELKGWKAQQEGFGIGVGLGHEVQQ